MSTGERFLRSWSSCGEVKGSMTVELLAMTPVLLLFIIVGLAFGRYEGAIEQVRSDAEAGAEAAAIAPSEQQAGHSALEAVAPALRGRPLSRLVGNRGRLRLRGRRCRAYHGDLPRHVLGPRRSRPSWHCRRAGNPGCAGRPVSSRVLMPLLRPGPCVSVGHPITESGSITAFVAALALALFALLGLVVDGGRAAAAKDAAQSDAEQAARAGADQLSVEAARAGEIALDPRASVRAAMDFLRDVGESGTAEVDHLTVTVHVETLEPTVFLGVIGIGTIPVNATASASLVHGVTRND